MFSNKKCRKKNIQMVKGFRLKKGFSSFKYSFTGYNKITGEPKSFFIEYIIVNYSRKNSQIILGQTDGERLFNKKAKGSIRPSYVMIKAGAVGNESKQIHNFYPTTDIQIIRKDNSIKVHECHISDSELFGRVMLSPLDAASHPEYMCDSGNMVWKLKCEKQVLFNPYKFVSVINRFFRKYNSKWILQGLKTEFSGIVSYDGTEYVVPADKSFGIVEKRFGTRFSLPWVELFSNNCFSEIYGRKLQETSIAVGSINYKKFGISSKTSYVVFLKFEDEVFAFSSSLIGKKNVVTLNSYESDGLIHWSLTGEDRNYLLDVDIYSKKDEMFNINYEDSYGVIPCSNLLCGGTGYGEFKLFRKNAGVIELVENATFNNTNCTFGVQ